MTNQRIDQLRLLDAGPVRPWQLDARTRHIGRRGVAEARRILEQTVSATHADLRRAG